MSLLAYQTAINIALQKRAKLISTQTTFRLIDGVVEQAPGLYVDYYGGAILAHYLPENLEQEKISSDLAETLKIYLTTFPSASIYLRVHPLDARKHKEIGAKLIAGPELNETIITEGALKLILNIPRSPHAGLYVDMRQMREQLAVQGGNRVINLFAFTGSLGLAAALGGAKEVCQVDSSPAVLEWGKRNFELNAEILGGVNVRFLCDDCINFLTREAVRNTKGLAKADLIICDPPSFGRGRKTFFSFKNDALELAKLCFNVLAPQGRLIFTCNSRHYSPEKISEIVNKAANQAGYLLKAVEVLEPPVVDFPAKNFNSIAMRGVIAYGQ